MGFLTQMGTPVSDDLDSAASWLILKLSRGVSNNSRIYPKVASYNQEVYFSYYYLEIIFSFQENVTLIYILA